MIHPALLLGQREGERTMVKWFKRFGACALVAAGAMALSAGPGEASSAPKADVVSVVKQTVCADGVAAGRLCIWMLPSQ